MDPYIRISEGSPVRATKTRRLCLEGHIGIITGMSTLQGALLCPCWSDVKMKATEIAEY